MIARMVAPCAPYTRFLVTMGMVFCLVNALIAAPAKPVGYSFNMYNTEIAVVLQSLAEASGANILVGPDVKGTVTVKLKGVTLTDALDYIATLTNYSYQIVGDNTYIFGKKPEPAATTEPIVPEKSYRLVKLQIATQSDITNALSVACPKIAVKPMEGNRLFLSGDPGQLQEAEAVIREIDIVPQALAQEMEETSYIVKSLVPWQAKSYVDSLYQGAGLITTFAPSHLYGNVAFNMPNSAAPPSAGTVPATPVAAPTTADWSSNELILRGPKAIVSQAYESLKKIDVPMAVVEKRVTVQRVYPVQAIKYLLEQFDSRGLIIVTAPLTFAATGSGANTDNQIGTQVKRDKDGKLNITGGVGDFFLIGPPEVVESASATLTRIDVGAIRIQRIYTLRFLQIAEVQDRLTTMFGNKGLVVTIAPSKRGDTPDVIRTGEVSVTAATRTDTGNTRVFDLILDGPEDVVESAMLLLDQLDTESPQISIKTKIVSIDTSEVKSLGIDWPGSIGDVFTEIQPGDQLKFGHIVRNPISINAALNILQTKNKAKLVSEPATVVQNGRQSLIHVGDTIYYETLSGYNNGTPIFTKDTIDAGVTLKVLPQLSRGGVITLEITTNISELVGFTRGISGADLPQLRETSSTNVVQVHDGETLVIGGLKQNGMNKTTTSVPILGSIPLIKNLFSSKTSKPTSQELLIMVTPSVLHSAYEQATTTDAATAEK